MKNMLELVKAPSSRGRKRDSTAFGPRTKSDFVVILQHSVAKYEGSKDAEASGGWSYFCVHGMGMCHFRSTFLRSCRIMDIIVRKIFNYHSRSNRGDTGGRAPKIFAINKEVPLLFQGNASKEKSALEVSSSPKFDMLPTGLGIMDVTSRYIVEWSS